MNRAAAVVSLGLLSTLTATGCSTLTVHRPLSSEEVAQVNDVIDGRSATLAIYQDVAPAPTPLAPQAVQPVRYVEVMEVSDAHVERETTHWVQDNKPRAVPTEAVQQISVRRRGLGALAGSGIGLLSGIAVGATIGAIIGASQPGLFCQTAQQCNASGLDAIAGGVLGGGVGLIAGVVVGLLIGVPETIEFARPQ
jgi:hypothetical protein